MELKKYQFWFCTGSQDLYGDECLRKVAERKIKVYGLMIDYKLRRKYNDNIRKSKTKSIRKHT